MKNHKNADIYDFSDYAEEITGDALFKINGGAEVENSHEGVAGAKPGDTITRKNGDVIVLKQADIDYAKAQLENNGNDGTGNTSGNSGTGSSSGTYSGTTSTSSSIGGGSVSGGTTSSSGSCNGSVSGGTSRGDTSSSSTQNDYFELPEANPNAYAYYMSKQGEAKAEGNPNKYKGYNIYGTGRKIEETVAGEDIRTYVLVVRQNDGLGNSFDSDRYVYKNGVMVFHDKVGANCKAEYKNEKCFTEPDGEYYFTTNSKILTKNEDGTYDSGSFHNVLIHQTNDPNIPKEIRDKINISPRDFLEHCNQYKISADLKEKSGTIYGDNLYPCSAGCTIGKDGQEHHDLYMSVLLNGVSNVENIRKEIRSISNIGK